MSEARWQHTVKIHANFCGFPTFSQRIPRDPRQCSISSCRGVSSDHRPPRPISCQTAVPTQLTPFNATSPKLPARFPHESSLLAEHIAAFFQYCRGPFTRNRLHERSIEILRDEPCPRADLSATLSRSLLRYLMCVVKIVLRATLFSSLQPLKF